MVSEEVYSKYIGIIAIVKDLFFELGHKCDLQKKIKSYCHFLLVVWHNFAIIILIVLIFMRKECIVEITQTVFNILAI